MKRRNVLKGIAAMTGGAALPRRTAAQTPPAMLPVGGTPPQPRARSFLQGYDLRMRELGYVEGQNFIMDYIDLQGQPERYPAALRELVERKPDVIIAFGP